MLAAQLSATEPNGRTKGDHEGASPPPTEREMPTMPGESAPACEGISPTWPLSKLRRAAHRERKGRLSISLADTNADTNPRGRARSRTDACAQDTSILGTIRAG